MANVPTDSARITQVERQLRDIREDLDALRFELCDVVARGTRLNLAKEFPRKLLNGR